MSFGNPECYLVVYFLHEAKNNFSVVKSTMISDGSLRNKRPSFYVHKTLNIDWGRNTTKQYLAKVLYARKFDHAHLSSQLVTVFANTQSRV